MQNRYEVFTTLINSINRSIRRIKNEAMKDYNLKSHHVSCLYYLYKEGGLTPTELTEYCDEDKAAISRSLDFLEKNEYLIRAKNKKQYNCKIVLTKKGQEVAKYITQKIDNILVEVDELILEENRNVFYETLKLIEISLKNH